MTGKPGAGPRTRRARARAWQRQADRFIDCWGASQSVPEALRASGTSWHQLQAWRRWSRDFCAQYEAMARMVENVRREEFVRRLYGRALAGSPRAMSSLARIVFADKLCPACRRPNGPA